MLLYGHLAAYVEGRLGRVVYEFDGTRNGFAAWQRLLNEMEPVDRNRGLVLLEMLTNTDNWPKGGVFLDQIREFERRRELYEQASGKKFDDDLAMATLLRHAPSEIQSQLRLDLNQATSYNSLRDRAVGYELTRRPWDVMATAYMISPGADRQGAAPMEIDGVKGKAGGGGKQGKDQKDVCRVCGGRGHWAKQCPSAQQQSESGKGSGTGSSVQNTENKVDWKPQFWKGKGQNQKGGWKSDGKGKVNIPQFDGNCTLCGKYGHKRAQCWRGVASAVATEVANSATAMSSRRVRRLRVRPVRRRVPRRFRRQGRIASARGIGSTLCTGARSATRTPG